MGAHETKLTSDLISEMTLRLHAARDDFHDEAVFLLDEAVRRVDGGGHVRLMPADARSVGTPVRPVVAAFNGWSPTLHAIRLNMSAAVKDRPDRMHMAHDLVRHFAPMLARQMARADDGMRIAGRTEPFVATHVMAVDIQHLHIDRALVDMTRNTAQVAWDRAGRAVVSTCEAASGLYGGASIHGTSAGIQIEMPRTDPERLAMRVIGFPVHFGRNGLDTGSSAATTARYDGDTLRILRREVPETALAAAVGQPLGRLVAIHEDLDDRIITSASVRQSADSCDVVVTLEPDLVPAYAIEQPIR